MYPPGHSAKSRARAVPEMFGCAWSDVGSPGSQAASFHTCQVLRPRRAVWTLAFTRPHVLPSAFATASAPGIRIFARLNGWPVCSSTDASPPPSRAAAHGSRSMWLATPSSYRTCTDYSLPVSRRTAKDSGHYQRHSKAPAPELPTFGSMRRRNGTPRPSSRDLPATTRLVAGFSRATCDHSHAFARPDRRADVMMVLELFSVFSSLHTK